MRKLVGVLILLAGLGLAANVFRTPHDQAASLDQVLMGRDARTSSAHRLLAGTSSTSSPSTDRRGAPASQPVAAAQPAPTRWQRQEVVVNYDYEATRPQDVPVPTASPTLRDRALVASSDDPRARYELARNLQTELRRVGCYEGEIDGSWGPGSKRAMSAFASQVNASLPVDEPDYVMLRLVQSRREKICGRPCPLGQIFSENGRCVPASIVAGKGAGGSKLRATGAVPATTAPAFVEPGTSAGNTASAIVAAGTSTAAGAFPSEDALTGRMSVGAPVSEEPSQQDTALSVNPDVTKPGRSAGRARTNAGVTSPRRSASASRLSGESRRWTETIFNQLSAR